MWKSMSKGELVVIYIIWLISTAALVFSACHFFGIGNEIIESIIPSGTVEVSEEVAGTAASVAEQTSDISTIAKDYVISATGNNPNNILIGLGAYAGLATLIYIIVAASKQRVPAIYFVGIFLHLVLTVLFFVGAPLF